MCPFRSLIKCSKSYRKIHYQLNIQIVLNSSMYICTLGIKCKGVFDRQLCISEIKLFKPEHKIFLIYVGFI